MSTNPVIIVGAGPAGLFAAYQLLSAGLRVHLYDHMSGAGKKFLVAGHGGLNLTHSESLDKMAARYGKNKKIFHHLLSDFGPLDLRNFCQLLEVETFIGSSGRVFPTKMKAGEMLIKWMKLLNSFENFTFFNHSQLIKIENQQITIKTEDQELQLQFSHLILSLGGSSWKKTGSTGLWTSLFHKKSVKIIPFRPMNCGFEINWSNYFKSLFDTAPIKNIRINFNDAHSTGEIMLTQYGIEGGGIYEVSREIAKAINQCRAPRLQIDLKPDLAIADIIARLNKERGKNSLSNHIRKTLNLDKMKINLLREFLSKEEFNNMAILAKTIKVLEIPIHGFRPIDEAISTSGGLCMSNFKNNLEFKEIPKVYAIGEMLDWDACTGGFLLQGCFSTAHRAAQSIINMTNHSQRPMK